MFQFVRQSHLKNVLKGSEYIEGFERKDLSEGIQAEGSKSRDTNGGV